MHPQVPELIGGIVVVPLTISAAALVISAKAWLFRRILLESTGISVTYVKSLLALLLASVLWFATGSLVQVFAYVAFGDAGFALASMGFVLIPIILAISTYMLIRIEDGERLCPYDCHMTACTYTVSFFIVASFIAMPIALLAALA